MSKLLAEINSKGTQRTEGDQASIQSANINLNNLKKMKNTLPEVAGWERNTDKEGVVLQFLKKLGSGGTTMEINPKMIGWLNKFIEDNELVDIDTNSLSSDNIKTLQDKLTEVVNENEEDDDDDEFDDKEQRSTQVGAGTTGESSNINPQVTNQPNPAHLTNNSDATKVPVEKSGQESSQKVTGSTPPPPPLLSPSADGSASKAVEFNKGPKSTPSMGGDLLSDILKKNDNLKSAKERKTKELVKQENEQDLTSMLINAMAKRREDIENDDDDDSDDDTWDDL